jgi:hypothetical protein
LITLSSEQGLINTENWDDVVSRPGYRTDLNPADHELDSIIGRYALADKIRCGLSNCHTPHGRGYIVATKEGLSTNIGKDCGKTYFGVDFETLSKQFDRDVTESENRKRLNSFALQVENIERRIDELRHQPRGADWVYKKSRALVNAASGCPEGVVRRISTMLKTGTSLLTKDREATSDEIDNLEVTQGRTIERPYFISDPVADIAGLQVLYAENDVKELLVINLDTNLRAFKSLIVHALSFEQLRRWVKWVDAVEKTIERAAAAVTLGRQLLTETNLLPFGELLERKDKALFRAYLATLKEQ